MSRDRSSNPRPITELLDEDMSGPWVRAIQRGKKLQQLARWVQSTLDNDLASHCEVLNLRGNTLILATDATVWATRLRYQIPTLLSALQLYPPLKDLNDIQIKVKPAAAPTSVKPRQRVKLSADAAHCLQQCAESINDTALGDALKRLAKRRNK